MLICIKLHTISRGERSPHGEGEDGGHTRSCLCTRTVLSGIALGKGGVDEYPLLTLPQQRQSRQSPAPSSLFVENPTGEDNINRSGRTSIGLPRGPARGHNSLQQDYKSHSLTCVEDDELAVSARAFLLPAERHGLVMSPTSYRLGEI